MQEEFGASNYKESEGFTKVKGILSTLNTNPGHTLSSETVDIVKSFYKHDEISWIMPSCTKSLSQLGNQRDLLILRRG